MDTTIERAVATECEDDARDRRLGMIVAAYAAVWIATSIAPHHRPTWLLENLTVWAYIGVLVATRRRFRFTNVGYGCMALALGLHAIGTHYTYGDTPIGWWFSAAFDLGRNHFDRAIHFAFGLLMARPMQEVLHRACGITPRLAMHLAPAGFLACSGLWELIEAWTAQVVDPTAGTAFLGTQGDEWDAQRDMTAALLGSLLWWGGAMLRPRAQPP